MARFIPSGSGLERARLAAGLSLAEVGAAVTRDPQSVRRWETGKNTPPRPVLLALARVYDTDVRALVEVD